ncbi:uncharacterized protein FTJAE_5757 [Fusarium tjaetaba]|uniref:Uncharacterized protein n=1 Tax=Fusarium tjaetaba TaxID=1567544 RepID=A0A8H5RRX5_9HYPO|nr:uncharacterized protein FTJAE_5757 [Fusarium tjaetaba]KAF5637342.1 hypothetical protein FTJAE_5757 [Fusarium tjaetaba]
MCGFDLTEAHHNLMASLTSYQRQPAVWETNLFRYAPGFIVETRNIATLAEACKLYLRDSIYDTSSIGSYIKTGAIEAAMGLAMFAKGSWASDSIDALHNKGKQWWILTKTHGEGILACRNRKARDQVFEVVYYKPGNDNSADHGRDPKNGFAT